MAELRMSQWRSSGCSWFGAQECPRSRVWTTLPYGVTAFASTIADDCNTLFRLRSVSSVFSKPNVCNNCNTLQTPLRVPQRKRARFNSIGALPSEGAVTSESVILRLLELADAIADSTIGSASDSRLDNRVSFDSRLDNRLDSNNARNKLEPNRLRYN